MSATRSEINRANAQHSTGPTSARGKARSSQNSFKHGLYSQELIIQGEDPAEFDHLRSTLRDEHQPANTTEEILVDELAQHFWRLRRFRELEARAWTPENLDSWMENGMLALINRSMSSAERSFHKALAALAKLQKRTGREPAPSIKRSNSADLGAGRESVVRVQEKARGFVPSKTEPDSSNVEIIEREEDYPEENICLSGFVPSKTVAQPFPVAQVLDLPCRDSSRH